MQSPLSGIPAAPQCKLPIVNYKYSPKSSLCSGIPLPRHSSPKSTMGNSSSRQSLVQQELDARSFANEDNETILCQTNPNNSYEGPDKKGDYSSDDSSNLSGECSISSRSCF